LEDDPEPTVSRASASPASDDDWSQLSEQTQQRPPRAPAGVVTMKMEDQDSESMLSTIPVRPRMRSSRDLDGMSALARVQAHLADARTLFDCGHVAAAAEVAAEAFACDPAGEGAQVREAERQLLYRIFEGQIGSLERVPTVRMDTASVARLELDHRFGFILDRIDGSTSFDDLLDIAGMPRLEAFRILETLLRKGVIAA
jgi:hypothetical protein